jgi:hypothetical protein
VTESGRVDAVLLRRSSVLRRVGIALAVAAGLIGLFAHGDMRLLWFIGLGTVGATLILFGRETNPLRIAASLGPDGVRVGGKLVVRRASIKAGWLERGHEASVVRLHRGVLPPVELEAKDEAEARTLLRAVDRDSSQCVVRFPSALRLVMVLSSLGGQLIGRVLIHENPPDHHGFSHEGLFGLLVVVLLFACWRDETAIGSDGVLVSTPLRRRFLPFAEIESAVVEGLGKVVLRTRTHGTIVRRMPEPAARAAVELIQASMASLDDGGSEPVLQQLRRDARDRDARAWLTRLRTLANRGSYRAVGLLGDPLWRVMDDPGATGAERAAAAVVLEAVATPAERVRLREAASRIASPRVRVAIDRVARHEPKREELAQAEELALALEALLLLEES